KKNGVNLHDESKVHRSDLAPRKQIDRLAVVNGWEEFESKLYDRPREVMLGYSREAVLWTAEQLLSRIELLREVGARLGTWKDDVVRAHTAAQEISDPRDRTHILM